MKKTTVLILAMAVLIGSGLAAAQCPPNTLKPAELREILKKYGWAVLFTLDVDPEVIIRDKATTKERLAAFQKVYKLVNEIESQAFYDGH